eukprot:TRINITY_DN7522_c0_g2_i1.p1 TRINITY_DN7522_c0_g2~~TRINITY_DN7522_c0_g2_i1.p1  ORF type:complete len:345 (+),score=53.81 TRINITY_DN7522_c0_g2_i1:89-1123(+)
MGASLNKQEAERIERLACGMADSDVTPTWAAQRLKKLAPAIGIAGAFVEFVGPFAWKTGSCVISIYNKLPTNVASTFWGLGICFYGGRFTVSIAAIEAFKATGGDAFMDYVRDLIKQVKLVQEANAIDDKKDEDGDGVADVNQIDTKALARRKMGLVLRTVDPESLQNAVTGILTGYMGVLAVLRLKFAKTVAMAHSIGDSIRPMAGKLLAPTLVSIVPKDYHRWINPMINIACKFTAGYVAWKVQRTISTVQTGVLGGVLAARSALAVLQSKGYWKTPPEQTIVDEIGGYSLAGCGIYFQLIKGGLPLPFFVEPFFWPLDILEWWLQWSVTWLGNDGTSLNDK